MDRAVLILLTMQRHVRRAKRLNDSVWLWKLTAADYEALRGHYDMDEAAMRVARFFDAGVDPADQPLAFYVNSGAQVWEAKKIERSA